MGVLTLIIIIHVAKHQLVNLSLKQHKFTGVYPVHNLLGSKLSLWINRSFILQSEHTKEDVDCEAMHFSRLIADECQLIITPNLGLYTQKKKKKKRVCIQQDAWGWLFAPVPIYLSIQED